MSTLSLTVKFFFVDLLGGIVKWPVWWYTKGLALRIEGAIRSVKYVWQLQAVGVWIKNIFVPMFGQYDWQSRMISVFMRIVNIIGRSIYVMVWAILVFLGIFVYFALPIVAVMFSIYHLGGGLLYV
ncbi:MAG: hypothetical protein ABH846_01090 [Patescibacteria group bacterium]